MGETKGKRKMGKGRKRQKRKGKMKRRGSKVGEIVTEGAEGQSKQPISHRK